MTTHWLTRLRYEPEEAEWALASGHLEAPWGGGDELAALVHAPDAEKVAELVWGVLRKDLRVAENTGRMCDGAFTDLAALSDAWMCWRPRSLRSDLPSRFRRLWLLMLTPRAEGAAGHALRRCATALSEEQRVAQGRLSAAASADLRGAVEEETRALDACAQSFGAARSMVEARGRELFS